jgi:hypothetical protein
MLAVLRNAEWGSNPSKHQLRMLQSASFTKGGCTVAPLARLLQNTTSKIMGWMTHELQRYMNNQAGLSATDCANTVIDRITNVRLCNYV